VDERRRWKRVVRALTAKTVAGQTMKLAVDERDEAVERGGIAAPPGEEESRNVAWRERRHWRILFGEKGVDSSPGRAVFEAVSTPFSASSTRMGR
jgi:hypothetical protein